MGSADIGFFTAQPLMLGGEGFPLFGTVHLLYLTYSITLIVVLTVLFRRLPQGLGLQEPRRRMLFVIAAIPLALLLSQDAIMIAAGQFVPQYWPLHSCNACELLALIYALKPNRFCGETLFTLGIIGASAALLFPNWAYCPPWSWPVVCGFTEHSLIIAFIIMLIAGGEFAPAIKRIWQPILFTSIYAAAAHALNDALHTNFLFVNTPATGSPLEGLEQTFGNPGYLVPFALGIFGIWALMYAIVIVRRRVRARAR